MRYFILLFVSLSIFLSLRPTKPAAARFSSFLHPPDFGHQTFLRQDPILLTSLPPFCHQSTGLGLLEAQDGSDHDFANNARRHSFVRMYVLLRAR